MSERRYRQRGYQDDGERPARESRRPAVPRDGVERPRGRGLGKPTATVFRCARCGAEQTLGARVSADSVCPGCGDDLHTCTNCIHFDTSAPNECREDVPAGVAKKSKRNDCELFAPKTAREFASDGGKPDDAKAAFDALFDL